MKEQAVIQNIPGLLHQFMLKIMVIFQRTNLIILVQAVRPDDRNFCSSGVLRVDFAEKFYVI